MKNYKLEKIKEELARSLARDQELLRLWEAVEYKTKKDGQPFKLISKSFENTTYRKASYGNYYILEVSSISSDLGCLHVPRSFFYCYLVIISHDRQEFF